MVCGRGGVWGGVVALFGSFRRALCWYRRGGVMVDLVVVGGGWSFVGGEYTWWYDWR